jgi:multiple sugar transport system substrate-binding protein
MEETRMKNKFLIFALLMCMLLSACGGAAATKPTEQQVTIKVMLWGTPEELTVWQKMADNFTAKNPNIKVSMDVSDWDSYWDKLNTLYAANTPPDLFSMDAPLFMDWYSRGALQSLQPYIDKNPGMLDDFYPITLKAYNVDGNYWGLPHDAQTIVLFYNKDMFDAAGIPYPDDTWTFDKLRSVAKQLTKDTNGDGKIDQWGFSPDLWDMELFWSEAIWGYGGQVISDDFTKTTLTDTPARDAWHFITNMVITDKSIPDPDTSTQFGGDPFQAGVAAMTPIGHWAVPTYAAQSFKFDVAPMPAGPAGRVTSVNCAGFVMAKNAAHPDEAWQFLKYVVSPEGQTQLAQLGLSIPVLKSIATSSVYLDQTSPKINQQVFVDALSYAHMKPVFRGYDEWSTIVGDGLIPVWNGEKNIDDVLNAIRPQADAVLAKYYH